MDFVRKVLVVHLSGVGKTESMSIYLLLHTIAYRYYNVWILSPYVDGTVIKHLIDYVSSIPGASISIFTGIFNAEEMMNYLQHRLAKLKAVKKKYPRHKAEMQTIMDELESLRQLLKQEQGGVHAA